MIHFKIYSKVFRLDKILYRITLVSVSRINATGGNVNVNYFRKIAWAPKVPLILRDFHALPAMSKWFQYDSLNSRGKFTDYLKAYQDIILPYEYTIPHQFQPTDSGSGSQPLAEFLRWLQESDEYEKSYLPVIIEALIQGFMNNQSTFQQFDAPLSLIMSACQFNNTRNTATECLERLYIAQSSLSHLPEPLSQDLPAPDIVKLAGKGDIYNSSIWLGIHPTYTPLHRDPNPNLFCQLVSKKKIRLMTPDHGDGIYARVRRELGTHGNSRFRGAEMMQGRERELLHRAVWHDESIDEVALKPGDALFIPTGWWHSVVGGGVAGQLNASVNWWFR
ncbi:hypothetical protein M426DRAFT_70829 [Hypoxylon sp. CI-4A]|nr:hypothetical protein M426DRAFT_70829 [Hypoxylon sp. CI-4A]